MPDQEDLQKLVATSTIGREWVIRAGRWLYTESHAAKLAYFDKVAKEQPYVASCVLGLKKLGVGDEPLSRAIEIVLFFHDCFSSSTPNLPEITAGLIDAGFDKVEAMHDLIGSEPEANRSETMKATILSYRERYVMAMYSGFVKEKGLNTYSREHETLLWTLQAILNAYLDARKQSLQNVRTSG